ncbi:(Fe-S)-binding protein [Bacillus horti]|uniref:Glycolate oxidase iron-sulfur subunit n=1 Tax=Caldalkalibacillus horti TaxID=77523 RepID=A0ABT9VZ75_9BACI|nr:(Fe-S)-binding protein [Bacillus horti]MDQ0166303.1 glycolate oxidase iron-sulfur subunit [Bacillus horti]
MNTQLQKPVKQDKADHLQESIKQHKAMSQQVVRHDKPLPQQGVKQYKTLPEAEKIQRDFQQKMDIEELMNCTRCGFCQPSCPTFVQTEGKEAASPRGRIALMKGVVDGVIEPDEHFERELSLCLGCRACETACPSGVNYGQLLEQARAILHEHKTYSWPIRLFRSIFFKKVLPSAPVLKTIGSLLWVYQRSGLQWLVRKTKLLHILLPKSMVSMERIVPDISSPKELWKKEMNSVLSDASDQTSASSRVQFFKGCIMDMMFHQTNQRTVKLAQRAGFNVHVPQAQTCCGALHAHAGDIQTSKELAKRNIEVFEQGEQLNDPVASTTLQILTNAGGCGAFLMEYPHLLKDEPEWKSRAERFASRIVDISEWLIENADEYEEPVKTPTPTPTASPTASPTLTSTVPQTPSSSQRAVLSSESFNSKNLPASFNSQSSISEEVITYQDSCHLRHGMKVNHAPRQLLHQTEGTQFVELKNANMCCGSAGIYNIMEQEMSMKVLDHKMQDVKKTQAKTIITSNPGCLLQMQLGIEREGLGNQMKAVHLVDFLYEQEEIKRRHGEKA